MPMAWYPISTRLGVSGKTLGPLEQVGRGFGEGQEAERLVRRDGWRYQTLIATLNALDVPTRMRGAIVARWRAAGGPALPEFAPYAAHVMTVDLVFNLALGADLISRDRPSNKIDIAYLYYLPFCMIFVSSDKLHARAVPCFLTSQQMFISGADLKQDLAKVDARYSSLPADVLARGIYEFAAYPPHGDYLVTALWDRYLPKWRETARSARMTLFKGWTIVPRRFVLRMDLRESNVGTCEHTTTLVSGAF